MEKFSYKLFLIHVYGVNKLINFLIKINFYQLIKGWFFLMGDSDWAKLRSKCNQEKKVQF